MGIGGMLTYDADNQVLTDGVNTLTYDANGNRTNNGSTPTTGNQLSTDGTWNYVYDANGNVTSKTIASTGEQWTYTYDQRNELLTANHKQTTNGAIDLTATYKYDALGNRIEKDVWTQSTGTVVTKFAMDGWNPDKPPSLGNSNWDVLGDYSSTGSLTTRYMQGDGIDQNFGALAYNGSSFTPNWYLSDIRGSVRNIINNSGGSLDTISYDASGKITSQSNSANLGRYAYSGREFDAETNLLYERARYYDPKTGRWMTQDPLGFDAGDSNLYRYVTNQPTNWSDPSGMGTIVPSDPAAPGSALKILPSTESDSLSSAPSCGCGGTITDPNAFRGLTPDAPLFPNLVVPMDLPKAGGLGGLDMPLLVAPFGPPTPEQEAAWAALAAEEARVNAFILKMASQELGREFTNIKDVPPNARMIYGNQARRKIKSVEYTTPLTIPTLPDFPGAAFCQGILRALLPPSVPSKVITYTDGTTRIELSGGPTSGDLANQALLLAPPLLGSTGPAAAAAASARGAAAEARAGAAAMPPGGNLPGVGPARNGMPGGGVPRPGATIPGGAGPATNPIMGGAAAGNGVIQAAPGARTWRAPNWQGPAASRGTWLGEEGNSIFRLNDATADAFGVARGTQVRFVEGVPDFAPFVRPTPAGTSGVFEVPGLTGVHATDQPLIRAYLAEQAGITVEEVAEYLSSNELIMHHLGGNTVQLVPYNIHRLHHTGGAAALRGGSP
jgi:RHS repeat-associated protein